MADPRLSSTIATRSTTELSTNKVLRNTYLLLSATLAFSAVVAFFSFQLNVPRMNPLVTLAGFFGLLFLIHKTANSAMGLVSMFAFTGFLGYALTPLLNYAVAVNPMIIVQSLGLTAFTFVGLSAYVVTTRADMSFLRGFVAAGLMIMLGLIAMYVVMYLTGYQLPPGVQIAISAGIVLLMSALILWETGEIVHGGQTNYILAATGLFVSIYNLFSHLLIIFGLTDD